MTNDVLTFGCRLNTYESEVIRGHLAESGHEDTVVFNSCAVTAQTERQLRQQIRRTRRERPESTIIVTGCAAQINPQTYAGMDEVDHVIGNTEKLDKASYKAGFFSSQSPMQPSVQSSSAPGGLALPVEEKIRVNDIMSVEETASHMVQSFAQHTRAFVQIQNGCDHRCTFCVIPYGRGNSRSVPAGEVVQEIASLVERGYKEVVLTGVDISAYGADLPGSPTLGHLCQRLLKLVPDLPRLRLSSIDAVEVDDTLLRLLAEEPRIMPHLHLSLQAGDDMILKRMKRRHLRGDAIDFCAQVRALRPDIVFGADIIAGFPTETEAMFQNSLNIVEECGLTFLHVFQYSERPGTPAAKIPNKVPVPVRKERAARLRAEGEKAVQHFLHSKVGSTVQLLVEKDNHGYSEDYAPVTLATSDKEAIAPSTLMQARVTHATDTHLVAESI